MNIPQIDELAPRAEEHFAYEEALLEQRGYADLPAHRAEHQELAAQVRDLQEQFRTGKLLMTVGVTQFLKEWLANHILTRDMEYSKALAR